MQALEQALDELDMGDHTLVSLAKLAYAKKLTSLAPGDTSPLLYADLSSVISNGASSGDLALDPASGDLYVGNASAVYKVTSAKAISLFYTLPLAGVRSPKRCVSLSGFAKRDSTAPFCFRTPLKPLSLPGWPASPPASGMIATRGAGC